MEGLRCGIALEFLQSSVGTAIGVQHQNDAARSVQTDRRADLLQNEGTVALAVRRDQHLCSSGDAYGIGFGDSALLEELRESGVEAAVKARKDGGIADIPLARRVEVEDFFQMASSPEQVNGSPLFYPADGKTLSVFSPRIRTRRKGRFRAHLKPAALRMTKFG